MRIEIAGAQITDAVVEVLDTLQNDRGTADKYITAIDALTRYIILDIDDADDDKRMSMMSALQMIRRDILTLAAPPDADDPENDTPTVSL